MLAAAIAGTAGAQRAGEFDLSNNSGDIRAYNRVGISYENTSYRNNWNDKDDNFSLNGFGLNYIHGFKLSNSLPMFLELGGNVNFNFGTPYSEEDSWGYEKLKMRNMNIQVPVNYTYHFFIGDDFVIAPYAGLNFKLHLFTDGKYEWEEDDEKGEGKWFSYFDEKKMGKDETWNRFQMGWQVGVGFQYSHAYLGVEYGTDFIPAYSYKYSDGDKDKISTGNLRITLGYTF